MKHKYLFFILCLCLISCTPSIYIREIESDEQNKPKWVSSTTDFWEDKTGFYYKSVIETKYDIEVARKLSVTNSRLQLAEQIKDNIKTNFKYTITENGIANAQIVKNTFYSKVDGLVFNSKVIDSYNQIVLIKEGKKESLINRYFSLLHISKNEYDKAVNSALQ